MALCTTDRAEPIHLQGQGEQGQWDRLAEGLGELS